MPSCQRRRRQRSGASKVGACKVCEGQTSFESLPTRGCSSSSRRSGRRSRWKMPPSSAPLSASTAASRAQEKTRWKWNSSAGYTRTSCPCVSIVTGASIPCAVGAVDGGGSKVSTCLPAVGCASSVCVGSASSRLRAPHLLLEQWATQLRIRPGPAREIDPRIYFTCAEPFCRHVGAATRALPALPPTYGSGGIPGRPLHAPEAAAGAKRRCGSER